MLSAPLAAQFLPVLAALPAGPVDGQECYYLADSTAGVVWHLRYRAASPDATYRWEYVGGPPLSAEVLTDQSSTATAYADLATLGPDVTLPLAGWYDVELGAYGYSSSTPATNVYMSYAAGGTAASDNDAVLIGAAGFLAFSAYRRHRRGPFAAGTLLRAKYRASTAATWDAAQRRLHAWPVKVG